MALCAFRSCPMKRNPKGPVSYYPFPSSQELFNKWVSAINRPNWYPTKSDYVCHYHFPKMCFVDDLLKEDAVPFVNPAASSGAKGQSVDSDLFIGQGDFGIKTDKGPIKKSTFSLICRLCGKEDNDLKDIFDNDLQILEKMSVCLPIVVLQNDGFPRKICPSCLECLDVCFRLIQVTLSTEEKLKQCMNFLKHKQIRKKELKQKRSMEVIRLPTNGPIDCDVCDRHFNDMRLFDEHMAAHIQDSPVVQSTDIVVIACIECGYLYKDRQEYENHKSERNMSCKKCKTTLTSVCQSHNHECPRKLCYICNKSFQRKKKYAAHMEKVHSITVDLTLSGPECKSCYTVHPVKSPEPHTCELKNGECSVCKEAEMQCCPSPFNMSKLPWVCKYCGKCMTTKVSLDIHERIHSGAKPYICERCGNEFRSKSNLLQHQLTHTGIRNHSCDVCGKRFARKAFVRSHMRVHTGERPFECDICKHKFTQAGDMKRHRNRHLLDSNNPDSDKYLKLEMDLFKSEEGEIDSS